MADMFSVEYKRDPFTDIQQLSSTRSRPLKRNLSDFDDEFTTSPTNGSNNGGPTKSRRVDPERLACRLDPQLVREMEEIISQGSRMPSFEQRKVLQDRYNVDRRHVYDYFHSRGMRVAKEDKHRNLSRRRALLNQAKAEQNGPKSTVSTPTASTGDFTSCHTPPLHKLAPPFEPKRTSPLASQTGKYRAAPIEKISAPRKPKSVRKPSPKPEPVFYRESTPTYEDAAVVPNLPAVSKVSSPEPSQKETTSDELDWDFLSSTYLEGSCFDSFDSHSTLPDFDMPAYEPIADPITSPHSDRATMYNFLNDHIGNEPCALEGPKSYKTLMDDHANLDVSTTANALIKESDFSFSGIPWSSSGDLVSFMDPQPYSNALATPAPSQVTLSRDGTVMPGEFQKQPDLAASGSFTQELSNLATSVLPLSLDRLQSLISKDELASGVVSPQTLLSLPLATYIWAQMQTTSQDVTSRGGPSLSDSSGPSVPSFTDYARASRIFSSDMRPTRPRTSSAGGGL
ncbi:hypothetical protein ONZ45_g8623 [Pleurotus djamor]|nr:hypothetical protein ONZ45_g8623 [Pleurotus djamor]